MILEIKNEYLTVGINTVGAEFDYIIKDNINRLYQRGEQWGRQSPLLFPIVGRTRNSAYYYNDNKYFMKENHGFANKSEFSVLTHNNNSIELLLNDSSSTLEIYPFKFHLLVIYELKGNSIHTTWKVQNNDTKDMLFNIGGHPGFKFNCDDNATYNDYIVSFNNEIDYCIYNVINNELDKLVTYGDKIKEVNMSSLIRKHNTVIFKNVDNATMKYKDKSIRIDTKAPYLAFWHPDIENPSFLCIEPWYGLPEEVTYKQNLEDKFGIIKLLPNNLHTSGYTITID